MSVMIDKVGVRCTGCMACYNICPVDAITMTEDQDGFYYPAIDHGRCTDCRLCASACPELNRDKIEKAGKTKKAFYGWHSDDALRLESSSGGIFTALAQSVLNREGIVFGAVHDISKRKVLHTSSDEVELDALRKSKYVQSDIGQTFVSVKKNIEKNRAVMFVGTPCQATGLKEYLKKDYANLLVCDFICHGVPSMKLLNEHISMLESRHESEHIAVDFRKKINGWTRLCFRCVLKNKEVVCPAPLDGYYNGFLKNIILRKSCYSCHYCDRQHDSDITLADFWGYKEYDPSILNEKGLSLLLANTEKGEAYINELSPIRAVINPLDWKYAEYVFKNRNDKNYDIKVRDDFFLSYNRHGYKKAIRKSNLDGSFLSRLKYCIKRVLGVG